MLTSGSWVVLLSFNSHLLTSCEIPHTVRSFTSLSILFKFRYNHGKHLAKFCGYGKNVRVVVWTRFRICLPNTCLTYVKAIKKGQVCKRVFPQNQVLILLHFKICGLCEVGWHPWWVFNYFFQFPLEFIENCNICTIFWQEALWLKYVFVKSLTSRAYQYNFIYWILS